MADISLSREWKQSLTTSKMKPFAMQVSLWDLMFFEGSDKKTIYTRYIANPSESNWLCKGFELPHNIIVLDEKMYSKPSTKIGRRILNKSTVDSTEEEIKSRLVTTFTRWSELGFDISLPWFDPRTKPLFLTPNNCLKIIGGSSTDFTSIKNVISPEKLSKLDFYYLSQEQDNINSSFGLKIWDKEAALKPKTSYDFYVRSVLKNTGVNSPNTWQDYEEPWKIATENDYTDLWDNGISTDNPGTSNADIILCGKDLSFEKRFIIPDSGYSAFNSICVNYKSTNIWKNFYKYYGAQNIDIGSPISESSFSDNLLTSINPVLKFLLKHCYLWFKCAFYADYVDYRDFNQSLNSSSQVIHKDLILGVGDFKRYEEFYSKNEDNITFTDIAKNTRPYFPTTTPSKDKLREVLLLENEIRPSTQETIKNIIDNASNPESRIGSLLIEPFENSGEDTTSPFFTTKPTVSEPPPIWFDPESRKNEKDYLDYPILIGKDGNLITSGRLLSPTIDELWQTIKELIAGKRPDNAVIDNDPGGYPSNRRNDGTPENNLNTKDTRFKLPNHRFKLSDGSEKTGDPTNIVLELANDKDILYRVSSWVSTPTSITYNIINELKEATNEICKVNPNLEDIINKIEKFPKPEILKAFEPTITIPSLIELEGLIKGLRWNLAYYINFMKTNAVFVGSDGKSNSDTYLYNKNAGTAYLLHKDAYTEIDIQKPNTVYDERKNRNLPVEFGVGLGKITSDMFGNNNQDIVPAHTVFMSAAGTWQSVSQALNIRIRDDEVW